MGLRSVYEQTCIHHYITIQISLAAPKSLLSCLLRLCLQHKLLVFQPTDVCPVYSFAFLQSALRLKSCWYVVVYCSFMTAGFGGSSISFGDLKSNLFKLLNKIPLYGLILSLSIDQLKDMLNASNL